MRGATAATGGRMRASTIYCGDAQRVLGNTLEFPDESVDLIYVDPPFFSNRSYEVLFGDGYELRSFEDRWKSGGIENYIAWMEPKIRECHRILKRTGTMYLHCDSHASHRLRLLMEQIFGENRFLNEIVWKRSDAHSDSRQGAKHFGRVHDTILLFTKSDDYTFNVQYTPLPDSTRDHWYRNVEKKTERRFNKADLTAAKPGGDTSYAWKGIRPPKGRYWAYSREKMEELDRQGLIVYTKSGRPYMKRYLDDSKGVPLQDWWGDISMLRGIDQGGERLGYPTQKPEALLERILKTSSNRDDTVLDPMCGCGTTIAVAQRLGRKWVGIDVSPTACKLMASRVAKLGYSGVTIEGLPKSESELKALQPFEFQNWVIQRLMGRVSARKTGDMGIDGYLFDGSPVQVKQSEDVGRNVIDNFQTALRRAKKSRGVIVALSFGKGAMEEVARAKNQEGLEITLRTAKDLLNEA
jgi:DNA modification methylase